MKVFNVRPTNTTPFVLLDPNTGTIFLKGRSLPRTSREFFKPIIKSIKRRMTCCRSVTANFELEYFNSSSSRCLFDILKLLSRAQKDGVEVKVNWCYECQDDDMKEFGEDYERATGLKFNYITIN